jgi:hypothetical protein
MNTRVIYAVGIGIIIIGVVFSLFNMGFLSQNSESNNNPELAVNGPNDVSTQLNQPSSSSLETTELTPQQLNSQNLSLSVNSVKVFPVNGESRLETAFNVYNPSRGSAILETITYNIYLDNIRVGSGDIGSSPEGFVDSLESVYTIIGNQSIVLRDRETLTEEATSLFDSQGNIVAAMADNSNASSSRAYDVNGTYFYTLHRGSDAQVGEHDFNFQYPLS